jgi:hypothetical protein
MIKGIGWISAISASMIPLLKDPRPEAMLANAFWLKVSFIDQVIKDHLALSNPTSP